MNINCIKRLCGYLLLCGFWSVAQASVTSSPFSLTLSLLSYSHFQNSSATTLCVFANQNETTRFQKYAQTAGYHYKILMVDQNTFLKTACQAVYFSPTVSLQIQNHLIARHPSAELLSFTLNDASCESRNIFCLYSFAQKYYFKVNLDSLALSKVRIDPRVLLLAKNTGE